MWEAWIARRTGEELDAYDEFAWGDVSDLSDDEPDIVQTPGFLPVTAERASQFMWGLFLLHRQRTTRSAIVSEQQGDNSGT